MAKPGRALLPETDLAAISNRLDAARATLGRGRGLDTLDAIPLVEGAIALLLEVIELRERMGNARRSIEGRAT